MIDNELSSSLISAVTPMLAQLICVLMSIPLLPLFTILLPLIKSSVPSSIPIRFSRGIDVSGVGCRKYVLAVGPAL